MKTVTLGTPTITVSSSGLITAKVTHSSAGYVASGTKTKTLQLSSSQDSDFIASNIKSGVNIFGITGTMKGETNIKIYRAWDNSDISLNSNGTIMTISLPETCKQLVGIAGLLENDLGNEYIVAYPNYSSDVGFFQEISFYISTRTNEFRSNAGYFTISGNIINIELSELGSAVSEIVCENGLGINRNALDIAYI